MPARPGTTAPGVHLRFHGLAISIGGDWPEVAEDLRLDFAWFVASAHEKAQITVSIECRPPDFSLLGDLAATFVTPRNVVYQAGERTVVDYFGEAVSIYDRRAGRILVQGEEKHIVHQAAYQFVLSRVGEHLDAMGLPRLHALGLAGAQGGVAVLLPSGGGKSTLALRALREDGVRLLSEDCPLIDRRGRLHPFPLRIGVNPTDRSRLPDAHVREIERFEFHPKLVLALDAFTDRIEHAPQPLRHLVVGRRTLGDSATLRPEPGRKVVGTLLRECVVGVGLYQGMEFVLQRGMRDVLGQVHPAATRAVCCAAGLARAKTWSLTAGRDLERNWAALLPLLS